MITIEERLKMFRVKRQFLYEVSMTFIKVPTGHSVADVSYDVFFREGEYGTDIVEWVTVTYDGGAKAHRCISGNSNAANFETVAAMIYGGCYDQNPIYDSQIERGYKRLDLNSMTSYKEAK